MTLTIKKTAHFTTARGMAYDLVTFNENDQIIKTKTVYVDDKIKEDEGVEWQKNKQKYQQ